MEKKNSSDQPESTRDENAYDSKAVADGVVDHGGRRESIAHNVIHNPLKVRQFCALATLRRKSLLN